MEDDFRCRAPVQSETELSATRLAPGCFPCRRGRIRECVEATTVCGVRFEPGVCVQPAVYALHHDPEHWGPEPVDQFVPER